MKVAFDQQVFLLQEYGGISRYICSLAKYLSRIPGVEPRIVAPLHVNRSLAVLQGIPGKGLFLSRLNPKIFRLVSASNQYLARRSINLFKPQIIHETYFSYEEYLPHGAKRVLTVYDMIHERYAAMFERSHMTSGPKRAAALRADHVICISENTRRDLIEFCGVPEERTSVVHLAADEEFFNAGDSTVETDHSIPPFLLYVGSRGGYKNFNKFLQAFADSDYLVNNFSIVCFGGGAFTATELTLASSLGLRPNQLTQLSGDDRTLAAMYQQAAALVYPSLYEGFGIPPLEAMAARCPVICSDTSSLPEVVGDAGEYFNPQSQEAMTAAIERVLQSSARRDELIAKGVQHCTRFSWTKCAQETAAVYRGLI